VADDKKPGKDISDLKARLGLQQRPVTPAPQAAPAPAAAPDPRRDPFAAQAPRPVLVEHAPMITDAGPQMHIPEAPKRSAMAWVKIAALVIVPLALGWAYGGVYNARLLHNKSIDDANQIKGEVQAIRKRTQSIYDALNKSFTRAKLDPDPQLIEDLKALEPLTPPKTDKIFKTNYAYLEGVTIDRLFNYYNDTVLLYATVSRFHGQADRMMPDLKRAIEKGKTLQTQYGVVVDPSGPFPVGNLVIWGEHICKGKQPDCAPDEWEALKVKASSTSSWKEMPLLGEDGKRVIPLAPDKPLIQQALIGSAEQTALLFYAAQLGDIRSISKRLVDGEKDLVKELTDAGAKGKVFTL
jgi:hypothetical protein